MTNGLTLQVCAQCGACYFPAHFVCAACGGLEFGVQHEDAGTVEFTTTLRRRAGVTSADPVDIVLVKCRAGPRVVARGEGRLQPGSAVELRLDGTVPVARAIERQASPRD